MSLDLSYRLDTLRNIATDVVDKAYLAELDELREKLLSGRPNLVVVGLFKRGKSSLVNALLERDLAPVAITPLTAVVTSFEHDPERSFARIYFRDGHTRETGISDIGAYVSEEDNPDNQKQVDFVRLFDHEPGILKTMTLIDTPGLGSAHVHNTAATMAFLPRIDAALFVLSADLPISQADIEFLKDLKKDVPAILFALNKKDLLREADLQKLMTHNRRMIIAQAGFQPHEVDIIPVSTSLHRQGSITAGNMEALRSVLCSTVRKDHNALLYQTVERGIGRLCDRLALLLQARLTALELPIDELGTRRRKLLVIPAFLASNKDNFDHLLEAQTERLIEFVREAVRSKAEDLRTNLPDRLATAIVEIAAGPSPSIQQLNRWILDAFEQMHTDLENEIKSRFQQSLSQFAQQPGSLLAGLMDQLSGIIQIDFSPVIDKFDLEVYAPFYLSLDGGPATATNRSLPQRLLPASLRQRLLLKQLSAHYRDIIVRNAAAVIYNLDYRIQESQRKFSAELQRRLHDLVNEMQTLLDQTVRLQAGYAADIHAVSRELTEKLSHLQKLKPARQPFDTPGNSRPAT